MTLDNLVGLGLEVITPDAGAIKNLLAAAARNRRDAGITQLSNESRFDTAYKAVMQMANAALQAKGYRTLTSRPGHHQTMIQTLPLTVGLPREPGCIAKTAQRGGLFRRLGDGRGGTSLP